MKHLVIPLVIFTSVALIILSGWLGYASVTGSLGVNLPLTAARQLLTHRCGSSPSREAMSAKS